MFNDEELAKYGYQFVQDKRLMLGNVGYSPLMPVMRMHFKEDEIITRKVLDMDFCFQVYVPDAPMTSIVTKEQADAVNASAEELDEAAKRNTVFFMQYAVGELTPSDTPIQHRQWVVASKAYPFGASIMAYPEFFAKMSEDLNSDLLLLAPDHTGVTFKIWESEIPEYTDWLRGRLEKYINEHVEKENILSHSIYRFSRERNAIEIVQNGGVR